MNYICYDNDGNIISCHSKKTKQQNIKSPYVLVDDDVYKNILENQNSTKIDLVTLEVFTIDIPKKAHYKRHGKNFTFDNDSALKDIREKRTKLLVESDWTALTDADLTTAEKTKWKTYRQALRDFPANCDPENPVWPVKPE